MSKIYAHILAARPNFIKAAPVIEELSNKGYKNVIIHTNQHYDYKMSKIFFQELNIPEPNYHLGIKSGTHGEQTGKGIIEIEKVLLKVKPNNVIVYGDVNSTLSGALAAVKLNIPIYHVESGCRSYDKSMVEEINRVLVDHISTKLFCSSQYAYNNLIKEGFNPSTLSVVGNTAIDTLHKVLKLIKKPIRQTDYYLCTLHRPFNVDNKNQLHHILNKLEQLDKKVIIPTHPRLKNNVNYTYTNIEFIEPLGYIDFINYLKYSKGAISDSGGIQCEASFLKIPLLTIRPSTEHLATLNLSNTLIDNIDDISIDKFKNINYDIPSIWDGNASKRIIENI